MGKEENTKKTTEAAIEAKTETKSEQKTGAVKTADHTDARAEAPAVSLDCDIIRDLVPSYLEHLCSESSEKALERHLAQCADCYAYVKSMRETMVEDDRVNHREVDYMKKMRRYYDKKVLVHLIGIALAVLITVWCLVGFCGMEPGIYEALLPVIALVLMFLLKDGQEYGEARTVRKVLAVLALLGICYMIGLSLSLAYMVNANTGAFGIPLFRMGPLLHDQIMGMVILETVLFLWSLRDSMQKDSRMGFTSVAALTGIAYGIPMNELLYNMESVDVLTASIWRMIGVFGVEGIVLCALAAVWSRPMAQASSTEGMPLL